MCKNNLIVVEFPGVDSADALSSIAGMNVSNGWTVSDLVSNNPQFFFAFGCEGVSTLMTTLVADAGIDLSIVTTRSTTTITSKAKPAVVAHPPHAPH